MFANTFQSGLISVFYSVGSNPLQLWDKQVKNGHIRRVVDDEVRSLVLEISGTNVATTYITCPIKPRQSLGVKMPFLVMIIKNMKKYFTFEIQILDDKDMHRRFRVSNFQSTTKVRPFCTTMPIGLSSGWNQVQFNLADFTKRAYGSTYLETTRIQIHANVRIRRIYFADMLYSDENMPNEYKLFLPSPGSQIKPKAAPKKGPEPITRKESKIKRISADDMKLALPLEETTEIPSGAHPTPAQNIDTIEEEITPVEKPEEEEQPPVLTEVPIQEDGDKEPEEVPISEADVTEPTEDQTEAVTEQTISEVPTDQLTEVSEAPLVSEIGAEEAPDEAVEGEVPTAEITEEPENIESTEVPPEPVEAPAEEPEIVEAPAE